MAVKNKIFIPTLISSVDYQPVRTLPHIYFYNGLKDCEEYFIQHYPTGSTAFVESTPLEKFPYFDYYDGLVPNTGSNSLLFFNETPPYGVTPTGSLYTQYWAKYVTLLYNPKTRLINASAIIPLADYFEMELNDIVQWRGNYYHLRAINDYNLKDGTCTIQLLGPIIKDVPAQQFDCTFNFVPSVEGPIIPTTTLSPTTTTAGPTTTTIAPTTTTTTVCNVNIDYLIVAGGGGGGNQSGGGGGGGGLVSGSTTVSSNNTYTITVGGGGALNTNGSDSTAFSVTATGGGRGGYGISGGTLNGASGGSGGGGAGSAATSGGSGTVGQGRNGGNGAIETGKQSLAGGGGGAELPGGSQDAVGKKAGNGGRGAAWLNGTRYAAGGGGSYSGYPEGSAGTGGVGGGGNGADEAQSVGTAGTANLGGGGGGGFTNAWVGGAGGSGVVVIRYAGTPNGSGGTITQSGGYTYHTFTSSGTFTVCSGPGQTTTTTSAPGQTTSTTTVSPTSTTTLANCLSYRAQNVTSNFSPGVTYTACDGSTQGTGAIPAGQTTFFCAREGQYIDPPYITITLGGSACPATTTQAPTTTTTTAAATTSTTAAPTTTVAPTTTTTLTPTTSTTIAGFTFIGCGRGNSVGSACSDALNDRTFYSNCSFITTGCTIYTNSNLTTALTGFTNVFIDGAVWDINSSTGVITAYSSTQC